MSVLIQCPPVPRQTSTTHPVQWDYTSPLSLPPHTCLLYKAGYEYICRSPALRRSSCTLCATAGGNWRWRAGKSIGPGLNGMCGQAESKAHCMSYFTVTQTHLQHHKDKTHMNAKYMSRTLTCILYLTLGHSIQLALLLLSILIVERHCNILPLKMVQPILLVYAL